MNKKVVFVVFLNLLMSMSLVRGQVLDMEVKGLNGPVKEIEETFITNGKSEKEVYHFNSSKQIVSIELFHSEDKLMIRYQFEYNENSQLSKSIYTTNSDNVGDQFVTLSLVAFNEYPFSNKLSTMSKSGRGNETALYYYDDQKSLVKIVISAVEGEDKTEIEELYENGLLASRIEKNKYMTMEYFYDNKGKIVKIAVNGKSIPVEDEGHEDAVVEKHDNQGRVISISGDMGQTKYTYNSNGYLATEQSSDRWRGDSRIEYLNYVYDEHKNWIKRTEKKSGEAHGKNGVTIQRSRKIIYYE